VVCAAFKAVEGLLKSLAGSTPASSANLAFYAVPEHPIPFLISS
jgi:hypothetical protein